MKTAENTLFGFAKISKEIVLNPRSGFSSAMIHLYIIISVFAKKTLKDGTPWNISYNHVREIFLQEGHNSKRSFRTAMEQLKKRGYIWQFRIPIGSKRNNINNSWRYVYICNDKPDTTFTKCVSCSKNGLILINGRVMSVTNCSQHVQDVQKHLINFAQQNFVIKGTKENTESDYVVDTETGEVLSENAADTPVFEEKKTISHETLTALVRRVNWLHISDKYGIKVSDTYQNVLKNLAQQPQIKCKNAVISNNDIIDTLLSNLNTDSLCYVIDTVNKNTTVNAVKCSSEYLFSCIYNNLQQYAFIQSEKTETVDIDPYSSYLELFEKQVIKGRGEK